MGESSCFVAIRSSHAAAVACSKAHREQICVSLSKLAALLADTLVYCGHEHTLANIRLALAADPKDTTLPAGQSEATRLHDNQRSTLPSTISRERAANPVAPRGGSRARRVGIPPRGQPLRERVQVFGAAGPKPQGFFDPAVVRARRVAQRLRRASCVCSGGNRSTVKSTRSI